MELLTALSSLTSRTNSTARARRSIRTANPDLAGASRRRRRHKLHGIRACAELPVEPGDPRHESISSLNQDKQKRGPFRDRALPVWAGDPQTYALLHCSVFKERTYPPGPFRTGSLTAPKERGVRVNER